MNVFSSCQFWFIQKKGLVVVLFWSFVTFVVGSYFIGEIVYKHHHEYFRMADFFILFSAAVIFPIAGWLGDVWVGRYKAMRISMLIMWIGAFLLSLTFVKLDHNAIKKIALAILLIGLSGFQANIVQFSMDQIFDSSSSEIVSCIIFYILTYFVSSVVSQFTSFCVCKEYRSFSVLFFTALLTLAVSSEFLFNHWLVKEPVTQNPLKLVFKVLRYAIKNKYPRLRSAFTYWDDKRYSRLDLAKAKYGGPFTTEEVENVKTFFRILSILVTVSLLLGILVNSARVSNISISFNFDIKPSPIIECNGNSIKDYRSHCLKYSIVNVGTGVVFLLILLWEFILSPISYRYMKVSIFTRIALGMILVFLYLASLMAIELIGQSNFHRLYPNETLFCAVSPDSHQHNFYSISYFWLVIPSIILNLAICSIAIAIVEFIAAQCPYSMKGLIFGMFNLSIGLSMIFFYLFSIPFQKFGFGRLECMFWYLLACIIIVTVIFIMFLIASYRYQNRQRDDNLPSQHYFAEQFYDRQFGNSEMEGSASS